MSSTVDAKKLQADESTNKLSYTFVIPMGGLWKLSYTFVKKWIRIIRLSWLCEYDNKIVHLWRKILLARHVCCNIYRLKWIISSSHKQSHVRMNFYNHHIRSIFKSHSISVTFRDARSISYSQVIGTVKCTANN